MTCGNLRQMSTKFNQAVNNKEEEKEEDAADDDNEEASTCLVQSATLPTDPATDPATATGRGQSSVRLTQSVWPVRASEKIRSATP